MNDKNKREKENLLRWAEQYSLQQKAHIFSSMDNELSTYWTEKNACESYLMEYGFFSLPDIKKDLDLMWKHDEIMSAVEKSVLVAIMKNEIMSNLKQSYIQSDHSESLPEFIYNF